MDKNKKLTLESLIAKKEQFDISKVKIAQIYINRMESYIIVNKPNIELINDAVSLEDTFECDKHLVCNSIVEPNIKDSELLKAYGCITPKEVLEKIFEPGEIQSISKELMSLAGYTNSVTLVDNLKN